MTTDEKYMWRCIELARNGIVGASPNPMVGAVIVCDGRIIGEGYHIRCGEAHAEVNAVRSVKDAEMLKRSTIYVSLEPCAHYGKTPPCAELIIRMGIPKVVVGCQDPFAKVDGLGIKMLRDAGVEVTVGVLREECERLNRRFITFHREKRPFVMLKWAQSADGFIDVKRSGGEPVKLSTPLSSMLVHKRRSEVDGIMVGTRTAILDNPSLTVRSWAGRTPIRIAIDRQNIIPAHYHLKDDSVRTLIFTAQAPSTDAINTEYIEIDFSRPTLPQILSALHARNVQTLMVEGGTALLQSFIDAGLWDEAYVERCNAHLNDGVKAPIINGAKETVRLFGAEIEHYENEGIMTTDDGDR